MRKRLIVMQFFVTLFIVGFSTSCSEETTEEPMETCSDGVQNQDETGVDCGGVCDDCEPIPTKEFWIKFKVDGEQWVLDETDLDEGVDPWCWPNCWTGNELFSMLLYNWNGVDDLCDAMVNTGGSYQEFSLGWNLDNYPFTFEYNTDYVLGSSISDSTFVSSSIYAGYYPEDNFIQYWIFEGTFSCKMAKEGGTDEIEITQGSYRVYHIWDALGC
ncbi:MAG: hypothetical protein GY751_17105 [Bacteroidetes bacterium]|nr:hypothetical protein [Bacteroidota bacterium]